MVIIPYQTGLIQISEDPKKAYFSWWTDNKEDMLIVKNKKDIWSLYISSCFMWHYMWSVIFAPVLVGVERLCATYYIRNYENVRRRHIPILLILSNNLITIPYAYFVINDQIPFMIAYAQCVFNAALVFFGYLIGYRVNVLWRSRMEKQRIDGYSLARKFQIQENIRFLLRIRLLTFVIVIYLSTSLIILICLVIGVFKGFETIFVHVMDNIILSAASAVSLTWIFCSPVWRDAFLKSLPVIGRFRKQGENQARFIPNESEIPETEIYFIQLRTAWV